MHLRLPVPRLAGMRRTWHVLLRVEWVTKLSNRVNTEKNSQNSMMFTTHNLYLLTARQSALGLYVGCIAQIVIALNGISRSTRRRASLVNMLEFYSYLI